jgi:hypothetical protein
MARRGGGQAAQQRGGMRRGAAKQEQLARAGVAKQEQQAAACARAPKRLGSIDLEQSRQAVAAITTKP